MNNPEFALIVEVEMEDEIIHTWQHPCCGDPTCPCREVAESLVDTLFEVSTLVLGTLVKWELSEQML
jgi:hypothetical protein